MEKTVENVRNRVRLDFVKKYEYEKILEQQPKSTFKGIKKSYENCQSYLIIRKNEVF